ncbi:MAG: acyltransferase [Pirellulaceae bacterium]|nr:acyltransferase [Pirellulaceae bacterium]
MDPLKPKPLPRIVELDALRALAALNLMLFHFTHVYSVKYGYSSPLGFEFPYGKYGVQLFFMLSGVVNALTILRKRDAKGFLASRCLRILPCYYIVIGLNLFLLACWPLTMNPTWTWPQLLANLTVMPNLFGYECLEPVMWTLQVEVLFYGILLTLFVRGWLERPLRAVGVGLAICWFGCWGIDAMLITPGYEGWHQGLNVVRQLFLLDYFPLFAVGILLHEIWRRDQAREAAGVACPRADAWMQGNLGLLLGIIASLVVFHAIDRHGHNPAVSVGLAFLLGMSLYRRVPILRWRPLVFVSSISYMLYLLHNNLGSVFIGWLNQTVELEPVVCFAVALPATIVLSTAAAYGLERPLTAALRKRFVQPKSQAAIGPLSAVTTEGVRR